MNNREAKEILDHNWTKLVNPDYSDEELGEAQNLAIQALEQTEKREEMIYMLLNVADVEANKLKDSNMRYDIGFRDGIRFITHKLEALMKLIGKEKKKGV